MVLETKQLTVEEFDQLVLRPENADKSLEYIGGKSVEVVSNNYSSLLASFLNTKLLNFVLEHRLGFVSSSDGGYMVSGERYIPDTAFISLAKQSEPSDAAYYPLPPDLAVEVLSPSNDPPDMRVKIVNYLRAGATVWLVDPDRKSIEVYVPNEAPKTLHVSDTLDGGAVLPGFTLSVRDVFTLGMG